MSNAQRDAGNIATLDWTLGDRLAKSLKYAGMKSSDMAEIIGVARNTISNYVNDHTEPSKLALKEWSIRTGVPLNWLLTGETGPTGPNLPLSDYKSAVSGNVIDMFTGHTIDALAS